jgi:DNA invertase Pin-like site-specific DNA recombinase
MKNKVVAYLRVSTDKQADTGVSLAAQAEKVEQYAKLYDLEVVEVIRDAGASAKNLNREGLKRALGMLEAGKADTLLVVKLDRLTRSVKDLGVLLERYFDKGNFSLVSIGEQIDTRTAAGRLVLNVLTSVAQWEREAISERTTVAMQQLRAEGKYTGGRTPFGYELGPNGELVQSQREQEAIQQAQALRRDKMPLRKIASTLYERGFKSRNNRPLSPARIMGMVGNG